MSIVTLKIDFLQCSLLCVVFYYYNDVRTLTTKANMFFNLFLFKYVGCITAVLPKIRTRFLLNITALRFFIGVR